MLYLAEHADDDPVPVETIAEAISRPRNYLSKTLHVTCFFRETTAEDLIEDD